MQDIEVTDVPSLSFLSPGVVMTCSFDEATANVKRGTDAQDSVCSLAYAVTQKTARQILYEIGLKDLNAAFDLHLARFCDGLEGLGYHRCLTTQPSLFQHHRPAGPKSSESDVSDHGSGWQDHPVTSVVRWSVRLNALQLMNGGSDFVDQWPDV